MIFLVFNFRAFFGTCFNTEINREKIKSCDLFTTFMNIQILICNFFNIQLILIKIVVIKSVLKKEHIALFLILTAHQGRELF